MNQTIKRESLPKKKNSFLEHFTNLKAIINNESERDDELLENIRKARKELEDAKLYFQSVTDPDLIDHAIYSLEAAKTKYHYLIKRARKLKKNVDI